MAVDRWFRFYESAITHDKVRLLPSDTLRWQWVILLSVASKYGGVIPSLNVAAVNLNLKEQKAAQVIAALHRAELLDVVEDGYFKPHDWNDRQPTDATAAERKRRQRQKERDGRDSHAVTTVTVTPTEEREKSSEVEIDQQSLTSLQITTSEGNFVGNVKRKGWTKPRHCAVSRDKKHVFIWTDTPEWEAYAADFRAIHQQEPQPNSDGGKWFSAQGEAA